MVAQSARASASADDQHKVGDIYYTTRTFYINTSQILVAGSVIMVIV